MTGTTRCRLCGGTTRVTHVGTLLGRHQVDYHLCGACDYWFTDEPYKPVKPSPPLTIADLPKECRTVLEAR